MAIKRRDTVMINDVGLYMQKSITNLLNAENKLMMDIDNLLNNYSGIDANAIAGTFKVAVSKLNSLINNLDYYSKYMQNISKHDRENIENANKQLKINLENVPINNVTVQETILNPSILEVQDIEEQDVSENNI